MMLAFQFSQSKQPTFLNAFPKYLLHQCQQMSTNWKVTSMTGDEEVSIYTIYTEKKPDNFYEFAP